MESSRGRGKRSQTKQDGAANKDTASPGLDFYELFDQLEEGCLLIAFDWTCRYLNAAAARQARARREDLIGRSLLEIYPGLEQAQVFDHFRVCLQERSAQRFEAVLPLGAAQPAWCEIRLQPVQQGMLVLSLERVLPAAPAGLLDDDPVFKVMFELNPVALVISRRRDGAYLAVNTELERISGYSRAEMLGKSTLELGLFADSALRAQLAAQGELHGVELRVRHKTGGWRWVSLSSQPILLRGEECWLVSILDIDERKRMEESLRESEQRFRAMFERHDAVMLLVAPDSGAIVDANLAAEKFYGYPRAQLQAMRIEQINMLPPAEVEAYRQHAARASLNSFIFPHRLAGGEVRTVEVHSSPITVNGSALLFSIVHDITHRQQAEASLLRSEALLAEAQRVGQMGYIEWNAADNCIHWSDETYRIFEVPRDDTPLTKLAIADKLSEPEKLRLRALDAQFFAARSDVDYEFPIRLQDGSERWIHQHARVTYDADGKPERLLGVVQDITARKQAEALQQATFEALEMERSLLRQLIDNLPDLIFLKDRESRFLVANQATASFMGAGSPEELLGRSDLTFIPRNWPVNSGRLNSM